MKVRIPRKLKKWLKHNGKFFNKNSKYIIVLWQGLRGKSGAFNQYFYDKKRKIWETNFDEMGGY